MSALETATRIIVSLLARADYLAIERITRSRRFNAGQLQAAVDEYGRTLVEPSTGWWEEVTVTPIDAGDRASFHIAAPLWTAEEGRSDLTLELRLVESDAEIYESEVLNLHVL